MKIHKILITGDDGYKALGLRILVHALRNSYDLTIASTKTQQSGVGGSIRASDSDVLFHVTQLDGIPVLYVYGTPVNAIDCAREYFIDPFDLVVSGINWGVNVSASLITSGTFAACYRAVAMGVARYGIAISWNVQTTETEWIKDKSQDIINSYIDYPGAITCKVINYLIKQDMYNAKLFNINLPRRKSTNILFTVPHPDLTTFFDYSKSYRDDEKSFNYNMGVKSNIDESAKYDIGAITKGYISITPISLGMLDERVYKEMMNQSVRL